MEGSQVVIAAKAPRFDRENFEQWRTQMKLFFKNYELLEVVEKGILANALQYEAFREAKKKDVTALYFIHQGLDNASFPHIKDAKSAKEAWDSVARTYYDQEVQIDLQTQGRDSRDWRRVAPLCISNDPEKRSEYLDYCVRMYHAATKGHWKSAKTIIEAYPKILSLAITNDDKTALHIAVVAKRKHFVKRIVNIMSKEDLQLQNKNGNTALYSAAAIGDVAIADMMVKKNPDLPFVRGNAGGTPLATAAFFGHRDLVLYLWEKTGLENLKDTERGNLFFLLTKNKIYDKALKMWQEDNTLTYFRDKNTDDTALYYLAHEPNEISRKSQLGPLEKFLNSCSKRLFHKARMKTMAHRLVKAMWQEVIKMPQDKIQEFLGDPPKLLFDAVALGNVAFLTILLDFYPDLILTRDSNNRSLFHIAAIHRQTEVLYILNEFGGVNDMVTASRNIDVKNNILHAVARLPSLETFDNLPGEAFQMQRELLWFENLRELMPVHYAWTENDEGELPGKVFDRHHQQLQKEGEAWMKDKANSCMLVATLVATVVFASAFSVPGGTNNTGTPTLEEKKWFDIFIIADTLAFFSSLLSIALFLSILNSRFSQSDFRLFLPLKMTFGLLSLTISILAMLLAFSASLFLIYSNKGSRITSISVSSALVVAIFYLWMNGELLRHMLISSTWSTMLFRTFQRKFYEFYWLFFE